MTTLHKHLLHPFGCPRIHRTLPALLLLFPFLLIACVNQGGGGSGPTLNELKAVVALAPNDVWAVGGMTTSKHYGLQVLIEHWDGAAWRATMPDLPGELCAISAISASDIWAVGDSWSCGTGKQLLILHWDGQRWQQFSALWQGYLNSVVALAPNNVWAVGSEAPERLPLIEHWDGQSWNVVPQPFQGRYGTLQAIAALSANDIWAVGFGMDAEGHRSSLAEHWDGQSWIVAPMPAYAQGLIGDSDLFGLTTLPGGQLLAAGVTDYQPHPLLIERWDGSAWQVEPETAAFHQSGTLEAIAAVNAQNVWVVGKMYTSDPDIKSQDTLVLHWDGQSWERVIAPSLLYGSQFSAIGVYSASDIWAVGSTYSGRNADTQTLIEHWNGGIWQPIPSPNPGTIPPPMGVG